MASRSVTYQSRRLRQITDLRDTNKSRYFAITEFNNNCFIIRSPCLFSYFNHFLTAQGSSLPFFSRECGSNNYTWAQGCQNKPATGKFHQLFWILRWLLRMLVGQFWVWYWRNKMEIAAYFLDGTFYSKTYWQPCEQNIICSKTSFRVRTLFGTKNSRTFQRHSRVQFQFFKHSVLEKMPLKCDTRWSGLRDNCQICSSLSHF